MIRRVALYVGLVMMGLILDCEAQANEGREVFLGHNGTPIDFNETLQHELTRLSVEEIKSIIEVLSDCTPTTMSKSNARDAQQSFKLCAKSYDNWKLIYGNNQSGDNIKLYQDQLRRYRLKVFIYVMSIESYTMAKETYLINVRIGDAKASKNSKKALEQSTVQLSQGADELISFEAEFKRLLQKARV